LFHAARRLLKVPMSASPYNQTSSTQSSEAPRALDGVSRELRALLKRLLPVPAYDALKRLVLRSSADRFRPSYDSDRWLRVLVAAKGADAPTFDAVRERWRAGQRSEALDLVVEHFATRQSPKFIFDPAPLLRDEGEVGGEARRWIALACDDVRAMTSAGLKVYGKTTSPLRPGFEWGGQWYSGDEDVLFPARPHRFAFAPRLALAVVGKEYSPTEFTELLCDWMRFAARRPELPFISTFVVTQRLIASSCALFFILAARDATRGAYSELAIALLRVIREDIAYLIPRVGTSYPNGHLLTDCFAGWFIAVVYPEFCQGRIVSEQAESLWLAELERQTYEDGGSFEHAVYYQGLATELAVAYLLIKRCNNQELARGHLERIRNMLRIQADLSGPDGNAPGIGDGAEDPMLPLDGGMGTTPPAMRELYRGLFEPSIPPLAPAHRANERAFWLLRGTGHSSDHSRSGRLSANPDAGLFVFFEDGEATRLVFRTGPGANTTSFSGHMHSDLLSICAVYKNVPILVDSGTHSYRWSRASPQSGVPGWRGYLAGPLAHNGIVVDDRDPLGAVTGDFRSGPALATVEHTSVVEGKGLSLVEATITSPAEFAALTRGVIHVRDEYLLVYTSIGPNVDAAKVRFPLQLHHRARVVAEVDHLVDIAGDSGVRLSLAYSDELALLERRVGSANPVGGWFSPGYGEVYPATQLIFRLASTTGISAFAFCLNQAAPPLRIATYDVGGSHLAFEITGADFTDLLFVNSKLQQTPVSRNGVAFNGRLLWLRAEERGRTAIRALDIVSCRAPAHRMDFAFAAAEKEIAEERGGPNES